MPVARADVDPTGYFNELVQKGYLLNPETKPYFVQLANYVCQSENAGYKLVDIGDTIAKREKLEFIKGFNIALSASVYYCSQLHPRLVP